MSDIKRYGSSGIHTSEGTVAGTLAAQFSRQGERQKEEYLKKKQEIETDNAKASRIEKNFQSHRDSYEDEFKKQTVGLQTAQEFREKRLNLSLKKPIEKSVEKAPVVVRKRKKTKPTGPLSFSIDEEEEEVVVKKKKNIKNPHVDTTFLPDAEREAELEKERLRLAKEWELKQEVMKEEILTIKYDYWDGAGHRRETSVAKKTTIREFLETVRTDLGAEFPDLRRLDADNLIYVKEDLIVPPQYSFYDLIVTKALGSESHTGKVVKSNWYEQNKHIYPANRWKIYDP